MAFYPSHEHLTQSKNTMRRTCTITINAAAAAVTASTNITIDTAQFS